MLKLTGGQHKNRPLKWLNTPTIRPTPARVREALFNILSSAYDVPESGVWWDLCCGSGVVGLEALSRGASEAIFVDQNKRSLDLLKENLKTLNFQAKIQCQDVVRWLKSQSILSADVIYCDPPYASAVYQPILNALANLISVEQIKETLLILEHRKNEQPWESLQNWRCLDQREYGDTALIFLKPSLLNPEDVRDV